MIIGIVSDIHSNYWALRDVLRKEKVIKTWVCLGDSVGLLPKVNETLDLIRAKKMKSIRGDHEEALLKHSVLPQSRSATQIINMQRRDIKKINIQYLQMIPKHARFVLGGVKFTLLHSLEKLHEKNKYLIDISALEKKYPGDIILYGHTHLPLVWYGKHQIVGNPGSLGFPVRKNKIGTYALLDTDSMKLVIREIPLNYGNMITACVNAGYPQRIIEILKTHHE